MHVPLISIFVQRGLSTEEVVDVFVCMELDAISSINRITITARRLALVFINIYIKSVAY
jgi:hypothetical protein